MNFVKIIILVVFAFGFVANIFDVGKYSTKEKTIVRGKSYAGACAVAALIQAVIWYLIYVEL